MVSLVNKSISSFSLVLTSLFLRFKILEEEKREGYKGEEEGGRKRRANGGSLNLVMCLSLQGEGRLPLFIGALR